MLSDIETLNRAAFEGRYEITRGLVPCLRASDRQATSCCRTARAWAIATVRSWWRETTVLRRSTGIRVAVPGELTTAFLTLKLFAPSVQHVVMPFDQIQDRVREGEVDAGLLIHEGQLTYADEGLKKIVDLGEWWADRTGGLPLPLGGNVIRRDLGAEAITDALGHAARQHRIRAQAPRRGGGLRDAVWPRTGSPRDTDQFVGMYVNNLTLDYGDRGRTAVRRLLGDAQAAGLLPSRVTVEFAS